MGYSVPGGMTDAKAPPGTPVGAPFPGLKGYYVNADRTPTPIAPQPNIAPDAPGGANNPISLQEAQSRYGSDYGVNISGVPTTPYNPQHDTRGSAQDVQDVAAALRANPNNPRLQQVQREQPDLFLAAKDINAGPRAPGVVSNPFAFSLAPGASAETTSSKGERITLMGGESGLIAGGPASPEVIQRLNQLGLNATVEPASKFVAGGTTPTKYKGIEPFLTPGTQLFPNDRSSAESADAAFKLGLIPVASAASKTGQGGFLEVSQKGLDEQAASQAAFARAVARSHLPALPSDLPRNVMGVPITPTGSYGGPKFNGVALPFAEGQSNPYAAKAARNQEVAYQQLAGGFSPAALAAREGKIGKSAVAEKALLGGALQAGTAFAVQLSGGLLESGVATVLDLGTGQVKALENVKTSFESGVLPTGQDVYYATGGVSKPSEALTFVAASAAGPLLGKAGSAIAQKLALSPQVTGAFGTAVKIATPLAAGRVMATLEPREGMKAAAFGKGVAFVTVPAIYERAASQVAVGTTRFEEPQVRSLAEVQARGGGETSGRFATQAQVDTTSLFGRTRNIASSVGEFRLRASGLEGFADERATMSITGKISQSGTGEVGSLRGSGTLAYDPFYAARGTLEPPLTVESQGGFNPFTGQYEGARAYTIVNPTGELTLGVRAGYSTTGQSTATFRNTPASNAFAATRGRTVVTGEYIPETIRSPLGGTGTELNQPTVYLNRATGRFEVSNARGTLGGTFEARGTVVVPQESQLTNLPTTAAPTARILRPPTGSGGSLTLGQENAVGSGLAQLTTRQAGVEAARISSGLTELTGGSTAAQASSAARSVALAQQAQMGAQATQFARMAPPTLSIQSPREQTRQPQAQRIRTLEAFQPVQVQRSQTSTSTRAIEAQLVAASQFSGTSTRSLTVNQPALATFQPQAQIQSSLTTLKVARATQANLITNPLTANPFPVIPTPQPPVPIIGGGGGGLPGFPSFLFPSEGSGSSRQGRAGYRYTPSLAALELGIKSRREPGYLTGLEVRPIVQTSRARRRKR